MNTRDPKVLEDIQSLPWLKPYENHRLYEVAVDILHEHSTNSALKIPRIYLQGYILDLLRSNVGMSLHFQSEGMRAMVTVAPAEDGIKSTVTWPGDTKNTTEAVKSAQFLLSVAEFADGLHNYVREES